MPSSSKRVKMEFEKSFIEGEGLEMHRILYAVQLKAELSTFGAYGLK